MTEAEKQEIVGLVMTQISSQAVDFDIATEQPQANDLLTAVRETESGGYRGVTIKWDDVARIATELANQAATRAEQAKQSIVASEENVTTMTSQVSSMKSEVYQMGVAVENLKGKAETAAGTAEQKASEAGTAKDAAAEILTQVISKESNVSEMKSSVETTKGQVETLKGQAETAQQGAEGARDTAEDYMKSAQQSAETSASNVERLENVDFRQKSPGKVILDVDVTGTMEGFIDGMEQEPYEAIALTLEPDVPTAESHNFGVRGQICIDSNYLYVCTALNTWKKISLLDL